MLHELTVLPSPAEVSSAGAKFVAGRALATIEARGRFVVAASGGRTPWLMYGDLASADLPWEKIVIYQVDERITGIDDPDRNLSHLRSALGKTGAEIVGMPVEGENLDAAADKYASLLPERFDLIHLGLGPDGHTASLVPGDPVLGETRPLVWTTTNDYQGYRRMTLTYPALARADELLWLVTGADKVSALTSLLAGDRMIPAGRVEGPLRSTIFADVLAAPAAE